MSLLYVAALAAATHDFRRRIREESANAGKAVTHMLQNAGINTPAPWCAAFVQDCSDTAAMTLGVSNPLDAVKLEALVASYAEWALQDEQKRCVPTPSQAIAGDLVVFNFGGNRWDHIGFVTHPPTADVAGAVFASIEGNTNEAGSREGDGVYVKQRRVVPGRTMFIRWAS